ncbi:MAG: hypothetical protein AAI946_00855 [Candidatus Hodgkinia cicadicola]
MYSLLRKYANVFRFVKLDIKLRVAVCYSKLSACASASAIEAYVR